MKLIDKLADEYCELSGDSTDASAFKAGFRKARELAAKEVSEWDVYWQDPDEGILSIGEEEVKD